MPPEQENVTPEKAPDSPKVKTVSPGQTLETSPVSPTDSSKSENAREARRQARRKLLEKMEDEGKLTKDDSRVTVITPEPSRKIETVESHTDAIPKRRNRRRKV